jgi:hypothetical protein
MADARSLTEALGGKWYGGAGGYGLAFCPAHDNTRTPALRLRDGSGGRLPARCAAGCDFSAVLAALRARGLIEGRGDFVAERNPAAEARRKAEERAEAAKRTAQARRLLAEAGPIEGTLGERYLRARAIRGPLPASLRFAPECWHGATARRLPAMVAALRLGREVIGAHRTYLAEPGEKADVSPVKAMLGPVKGGAVALAEGAGRRRSGRSRTAPPPARRAQAAPRSSADARRPAAVSSAAPDVPEM